ncbi:MAG: aminotransferase [Alphaproteobacteria bacterium]|nr:MAG: aminotransferase [Alphaproteobacteria bacterium]
MEPGAASGRNDAAQELTALDQAHVLHPWTHFGSFARDGAMVIARGEGVWLWDANGQRYLDAVGGLWNTQIGLGNAEMAEAIAEQVRELAFSNTFVDLTNPPSARLAARVARLAPAGLSHVHFTTGGSTAVDTAYRMVGFYQACRGRPEKTHVIARRASYHGSTFIAMSIGLRDGDRVPEFRYQTEGIHHVSAPDTYRAPGGLEGEAFTDWLVAEFEETIERVGPERVGAFFAEPVQASGGVLVPPPGYLRRMAEVCRRHDILFVADEVVTGFGRLGHWFASEDVFEVRPDIICCAKGLSSGYLPIGAVVFSDAIWDAMASDPDRWFTHGFTYSGHPVAARAAEVNLEIMERERILEHVRETGPYLLGRLGELRDLPLVGDVRGIGLMACIENVADKASRARLPDEVNIGKRISDKAEGLGLMVRPMGHLNVMSPPLVIDREGCDYIVDRLGRAIREVADDLVREGVEVR